MEKHIPSILTIDDDSENLILISKMLERSFDKINIYSASSGVAGYNLVKKYLPDTIILDVLMYDLDGFSVCKALKNNNDTKNIPVIMITGAEITVDKKIKSLNIGADAFLSKPLRKAELIAQINAMLRIKFAEDKIKNEKRELEKLVEARTKSLSQLAAHTLSVQEEERSRISRGLHDELGQMLVGLQMGHDSLLKTVNKLDVKDQNKKILISKTEELVNMTEYTFESVRKIIQDLRPIVLDHLGLLPAIKWLVQDFSKNSDFNIVINDLLKSTIDISEKKKTAVFRIFQESLTNIVKHSKATEVIIHIKRINDSDVLFEIKDNGCGIIKDNINDHKCFGVLGMKERASQFGWTIEITSAIKKGTIVSLTITV